MEKSADAFRTISEVADLLDTPAHVLRFWESRFPQIKPVKRAGGRRYYRPSDVALLQGIKRLLHDEGMTIRGVQKILREQGVRHVSGLSEEITPEEAALEEAMLSRLDDDDDEAPLPPEDIAVAQAEALEEAIEQAALPFAEAPIAVVPKAAVVTPFPGAFAPAEASPPPPAEPERPLAAATEVIPDAPMAEDVPPLIETAAIDHIFAGTPDNPALPLVEGQVDLPVWTEPQPEPQPEAQPAPDVPPAAAKPAPAALPAESTALAMAEEEERAPLANRLRALPPGARLSDPARSRSLVLRLIALRNSMAGNGQSAQN